MDKRQPGYTKEFKRTPNHKICVYRSSSTRISSDPSLPGLRNFRKRILRLAQRKRLLRLSGRTTRDGVSHNLSLFTVFIMLLITLPEYAEISEPEHRRKEVQTVVFSRPIHMYGTRRSSGVVKEEI